MNVSDLSCCNPSILATNGRAVTETSLTSSLIPCLKVGGEHA